jgi:hypothetical protein
VNALAKLVTISVYSEPSEAAVAQSCLRAHGLVAILPEWHHASVAWHHVNALQGLRLVTVAPMAAEARALLGLPEAPDRPPPDTPQGLLRPDVKAAEWMLAVAAFLLTGLPLPLWKRHRTPDHGHRPRDEDDAQTYK